MAKFYFSYGTDERFPYRNGWTTVIASDYHDAAETFRKHHPDRPGENCLNCAFMYTAEQFETTEMFLNHDNFGAGEHEVLISDNIPRWAILAKRLDNKPLPYPFFLGIRAAENEIEALSQVNHIEGLSEITARPVK